MNIDYKIGPHIDLFSHFVPEWPLTCENVMDTLRAAKRMKNKKQGMSGKYKYARHVSARRLDYERTMEERKKKKKTASGFS
jgi:hypothetical protein